MPRCYGDSITLITDSESIPIYTLTDCTVFCCCWPWCVIISSKKTLRKQHNYVNCVFQKQTQVIMSSKKFIITTHSATVTSFHLLPSGYRCALQY